jgi:hypothetical protein
VIAVLGNPPFDGTVATYLPQYQPKIPQRDGELRNFTVYITSDVGPVVQKPGMNLTVNLLVHHKAIN